MRCKLQASFERGLVIERSCLMQLGLIITKDGGVWIKHADVSTSPYPICIRLHTFSQLGVKLKSPIHGRSYPNFTTHWQHSKCWLWNHRCLHATRTRYSATRTIFLIRNLTNSRLHVTPSTSICCLSIKFKTCILYCRTGSFVQQWYPLAFDQPAPEGENGAKQGWISSTSFRWYAQIAYTTLTDSTQRWCINQEYNHNRIMMNCQTVILDHNLKSGW